MEVKTEEQANKEHAKAIAKYKSQLAALKKGTKYVTLRKGRSKHDLTLLNGTVAQASSGLKTVEGWTSDRLIDWSDRCRVAVFLSESAGALGEQVKQPVEMPKL